MDEPELPPLSQVTSDASQSRPRPSFLLTRKRTHSDYIDDPATSSDPATFSSDETAPGAESYTSGGKRKKHTYKGTWWDRHPVKNGIRTSQRNKREFRRNFDSGIFMGSESEEPLSSDSFTMEDEFLNDQHQLTPRPPARWPRDPSDATPRAKPMLHTKSKEHDQVCDVVRQCLEVGKEAVDLSAMSLSDLPAEVTTLATLSKQDELAPGMLHMGTNLEPRIQLFLGNNLFAKVPSQILELRNLRVLSLRNNNLTSIPPGIRNLVNLEVLNVASNQLTYLPSEILDLVNEYHLHDLTLEPNPWAHPDTAYEWKNCPVSPNEIRYVNLPFDHLLLRRVFTTAQFINRFNLGQSETALPSLTELVLRQLSKIDTRSDTDLAQYMPPGSPQAVLDHLNFLKGNPDRRCGACRRPIVHASTEIMEWWDITANQPTSGPTMSDSIPFRRLLCWTGCRGLQNRASDENAAV